MSTDVPAISCHPDLRRDLDTDVIPSPRGICPGLLRCRSDIPFPVCHPDLRRDLDTDVIRTSGGIWPGLLRCRRTFRFRCVIPTSGGISTPMSSRSQEGSGRDSSVVGATFRFWCHPDLRRDLDTYVIPIAGGTRTGLLRFRSDIPLRLSSLPQEGSGRDSSVVGRQTCSLQPVTNS